MGGAGCGSGGGVWGNGFTSLRRVVFSFVTVSRASLFLYVRVTVSSLVLSFLFSGFYIRLLHCVEFPLTHARRKASVTSTARGGADYAGGRRSGSGGYFYILADGEGNDPFLVHRAPSVSSSSSRSTDPPGSFVSLRCFVLLSQHVPNSCRARRRVRVLNLIPTKGYLCIYLNRDPCFNTPVVSM